MSLKIGLYYPSYKFEDINWLKYQALYWDSIARIVPENSEIKDSQDVKEFSNELNFIYSITPTKEEIINAEDKIKKSISLDALRNIFNLPLIPINGNEYIYFVLNVPP